MGSPFFENIANMPHIFNFNTIEFCYGVFNINLPNVHICLARKALYRIEIQAIFVCPFYKDALILVVLIIAHAGDCERVSD